MRPITAAGANCDNIAFLDEEKDQVTLYDESLRRAIADFNAKLVVIDPVQAYLGDTDMASASGMRRILRQLALWASLYECAIVLIGHLNKKQNSKELYRSLGSIDLVAAARSVIHIERLPEDDSITVLQHVKSSLTPRGKNFFFTIDVNRCIEWLDHEEVGDCYLAELTEESVKQSKQAQAAELLRGMLADGPVKSTEIQTLFRGENISERTIQMTKKTLGIHSVKRDGVWYWQLPNSNL